MSEDPTQQLPPQSFEERVLAEFAVKQQLQAKRIAQVRRARFGSPWIWVSSVLLVWTEVAVGWVADLSSTGGRIALLVPVVGMFFVGLAMARSIKRAREALFLAII